MSKPPTSDWPGPLAGVRVVDFTRVLAGPFATQILGDLGAEILKIESPGGGDVVRGFPPRLEGGEGHYFVAMNRNKKSVVIDLKREEGVATAKRLIARSDVVVENFRPGVMARMGLGYEALAAVNPKIVLCSISGFGQTGPLRDTPSFDVVTQAYSGVMTINGEPGHAPVKLGLPMGDMVGGVFGAPAILAVLLESERTGRGRHIDISLLDGMLGMLGYLAQRYLVTGESPAQVGSGHALLAPYGAFPTADGHLIVACLTETFWHNFAHAIGRADLIDDPRFCGYTVRIENRTELDSIIAEVMSARSTADWAAILALADVPHAPVLDVGEALEHPHAQSRGMVECVEHPTAGPVRSVGRPVKFADANQRPLEPSPVLGADTRAVLEQVAGMDRAAIDALIEAGVVACERVN